MKRFSFGRQRGLSRHVLTVLLVYARHGRELMG